jgi:hypothetical protein
VDLAFWFTFAGYNLPHRSESRRDLDMISYGVVTMLEAGPPAGYQDLGWAPRLALGALANQLSRSDHATPVHAVSKVTDCRLATPGNFFPITADRYFPYVVKVKM